MKSVVTLLIGLLGGVVLGWSLYPVFNPSKTPAANDIVISDSSTGEKTTEKQLIEPLDFKGTVRALIKSNHIEPAVDFLSKIDVTDEENLELTEDLTETLLLLVQNEEWDQLRAWLQKLEARNIDLPIIRRLQAQIHKQEGSFQTAVETLFVALDRAENWEDSENIQAEIEDVVFTAIDLYEKDGMDHLALQSLLNYMIEKEPDFPPYSIELSKVYADQGDITAAITILERIPENPEYTETIVVLKNQLLVQKNSEAQWGKGIPLIAYGNHFMVEADINSEEGFRLLIDTGATFSVLSSDSFEKLRSSSDIEDSGESITINTAGGVEDATIYTVDYFSVGGYYLENLKIVELNLDSLNEGDGLLGMDFLKHYKFEIDQVNNKLYLAPL